MPQFNMILIDEADAKGMQVETHVAGSPLREGGGDETYRCGACKTKLLVNVAHRDAHGAVIVAASARSTSPSCTTIITSAVTRFKRLASLPAGQRFRLHRQRR
ncbi:MAG: hypothetical protein R3C55_08120 [Parvularculaceae bacterium]